MSPNEQPQNAPKRRRIIQSSFPNTVVIDFSIDSSYRCQYCDYQTNKRSNYAKHIQTQHQIVDLTTDVAQQEIPQSDSQMESSHVATDEHDWKEDEDSDDDDVDENEGNYTQETLEEYPMSTEETIPNLQHLSYHFESSQHFLCHVFFNASDSVYLEYDVKKIMSFVRQIVNLTNDNEFTLPSDNKIIDFANSVRSNIHTFDTTEHEAAIANTDQKAKFYMNKPFEYFKNLVTNPSESNQLSKLPDYTPNEGMLFNQPGKWRDHPLF
ncbi:hypothetical protein EDC96DRAFT_550627 [Choanephora cucurbitarum]|nr:hypothetical protein EDC96DRAFT_550627 [Choanephora cucurbitarum]